MTTQEAFESWKSDTCPACGSFKRNDSAVCSLCFSQLSQSHRSAISKIGGGAFCRRLDAAVASISLFAKSEVSK